MKRLTASCLLGTVFFLLTTFSAIAWAAAPQRLNVQGVIRDSGGNPATGSYSIRFGLYSAQVGGTEYWSEVLANISVASGVFTAVLGTDPANPLPGDLFANTDNVWLGVRVEAEPELPRQRLISVPYALEAAHAAEAEMAFGLECSGCVALSELGFDPATQNELDALRSNPLAAMSCNAGYILVFNGTQWTCSGDYVTQAQLGPYVTETELTTALQPFIDQTELNSALLPLATDAEVTAAIAALGQTLGQLSCTAGQSVIYSGATTGWACSSGFALAADLEALQTAFEAHAADPAAHGQPYTDADVLELVGQTLGQMTCAADEVAVYDGTEWVCSGDFVRKPGSACNTPGHALQWDGSDWSCVAIQAVMPSEPCDGPWESLQWDGVAFQCVDLRASGLSLGQANGFEVIDDWGYVWDGTERGAKTWQQAQATCVADGGRLPTITELFRNNATSGTGNLGTTSNTNEMWSLISNYQGYYVTVRLSDGGINYRAATGSYNFRCVWPDHVSSAFEGDYCYGPPGQECAGVRRFYNVDKYDRPSVDFVAASHECNFYNGSIPVLEDWSEIIHSGVAGTWGNWLWGGDLMYYGSSPYLLHEAVNFSSDRAPYWAFDSYQNNFGTWNWPTSTYRYRCMGKRSANEGVNPTSPQCQGGCFSVIPSNNQGPDHAGRRAPIWADSRNRSATTRDGAAQQCNNLGGSLPNFIEFQELIHAGWAFDTGTNEHTAWLWTASPVYHGNYQNLLARRGTWTAPKTWYAYASDNVSWDAGNSNYAFRCVWHQTFQSTPPSCPVGQVLNWNGTQFSCTARVAGADNGEATGGGWTDDWQNVWDRTQRGSGSLSSAAEICQLRGGRLPTPTELYRVRQGGPDPIPNATTDYLWTNMPSYRIDYNTTLRISDGTTNDNCSTGSCSNLSFRCIWPTSRGSAFSSNSCSGDAGTSGNPQDACYHTGRYAVDKNDRAKVPTAAAAHECMFFGGWPAALRGLEDVIHGGAPNGDWSSYVWIMEPTYASYFRMALGRWSGMGTSGWYWNNQVTSTANLDYAYNRYGFRCVFNDILR